jgi:hypothetical protein
MKEIVRKKKERKNGRDNITPLKMPPKTEKLSSLTKLCCFNGQRIL